MNPNAKPRSDAWDAVLTEAQRWEAYAVFGRSPWYEVSAWVAKEFNLPAPSRNALYRWAKRMRGMESAHRIEQAVMARAEIGALANTAALDEKLVAAYQSLGAELALKGDAAVAMKFTRMAMDIAAGQTKRAELKLKDEQLQLARDKFAAADARLRAVTAVVEEAKGKGGLTPETLQKIEEAAKLL